MKTLLSREPAFCVERKGTLSGSVFFLAIVILMFPGCATERATHDVKGQAEGQAAVISKDGEKDETGQAVEGYVPRISQFILGTGDELEITVFRKDDLNQTVRIGPSGKIMYPLIGDIHAEGVSVFQLRDIIRHGLSKYTINPQVSVRIVSVRSKKVIVLGEVNRPGFLQPEAAVTLLEAISQAGGFTRDSEQKSILLIRGGMETPELRKLDLTKIFKEGDLSDNVLLQSGDIVYVPNTFISDVSRFFAHLSLIISPIVEMQRGYLLSDEIIGQTRSSVRTR